MPNDNSDLGYLPIFDLDPAKVGDALQKLPAIAASMGHTRPTSTANPYLQKVRTPEAQFVYDVLTQSTEKVCERWFGGMTNAALVAGRLSQAAYGERPEL